MTTYHELPAQLAADLGKLALFTNRDAAHLSLNAIRKKYLDRLHHAWRNGQLGDVGVIALGAQINVQIDALIKAAHDLPASGEYL